MCQRKWEKSRRVERIGIGAVPPPEILALIAIAFFTAGIIKGMVGLGLPIIVLVFLALPLGVTSAISLMLVPAIVTNIAQAVSGPSLLPLIKRLWSFLLAAAMGIWFGVGLLSVVEPGTTLMVLGALLAAYSIVSLFSPQIRPPGRYEPILSPLAGGLGGVAFGVTGVFIVPGILYIQALGLKKDALVQALGIVFMTLSVTLLGAFLDKGFMTSTVTLVSFGAVAPAVLGLYLGQKMRHRVSEALFRTVFFWALLVTGLYFIASGWR